MKRKQNIFTSSYALILYFIFAAFAVFKLSNHPVVLRHAFNVPVAELASEPTHSCGVSDEIPTETTWSQFTTKLKAGLAEKNWKATIEGPGLLKVSTDQADSMAFLLQAEGVACDTDTISTIRIRLLGANDSPTFLRSFESFEFSMEAKELLYGGLIEPLAEQKPTISDNELQELFQLGALNLASLIPQARQLVMDDEFSLISRGNTAVTIDFKMPEETYSIFLKVTP